MIKIHQTECCALIQITCGNEDTRDSIKRVIDVLIKEADSQSFVMMPKGYGARAVFVISCPGEELLEANLKAIGFEHTRTFGRRKGYLPGVNKMWMLNW